MNKKTPLSRLTEKLRLLLAVLSFKLKKAGDKNQTDKKVRRFFFRFPLREQILLIKRLSILLKAGVPILQATNAMKKQRSSKSTLALLEDLSRGIENGNFIHTTLEKYSKHLGEFTINIIRIGELSGTLDENMEYLIDELKKKRELKRKLIGSLVYPMFVVIATLGIVTLLVVYIFPKILPILQGFKGDLPVTTRILIATSSILIHQGWIVVLALFTLACALWLLKRLEPVRLFLNRLLLKIPIFGKLFQYYYIVNLCRTLGLLLKSNIRIMEAIAIAAKTNDSLVYRQSLLRLYEAINKGGKISKYIEKEQNLFPPMIAEMVTVGEVSGNLSDSLLYLAEIYENEVDDLTKNLSSSIEPLLMIFMGILVGFVALSIITPIYQLSQNLHP